VIAFRNNKKNMENLLNSISYKNLEKCVFVLIAYTHINNNREMRRNIKIKTLPMNNELLNRIIRSNKNIESPEEKIQNKKDLY
jgi:hypothetical protein